MAKTQKPLVFISHVGDEREVALALKRLVTDAFIGIIDVFVSSDPNSLAMGEKWLDQITDGLTKCVIEIVLASPASVKRPWINFEAGAGWVRDVPVIPICHSGMTPSTLPPPLSSLQAALATEAAQLQNVFAVVARAIGCTCPQVDFSDFVESVKAFEDTSRQLDAAERVSLTSDVDGLSEHAVATLVAAAECTEGPGSWTWADRVQRRMNEAGYRDIATNLGIAALARHGLLVANQQGTGNFGDTSLAVEVSNAGWTWLEEHLDLVDMRLQPSHSAPADDGIPF